MVVKKIFKKNKSNKKNTYMVLFFLIIFIFIAYFYFFNENKDYIVISANENNFYVIPKDRGGQKVDNLDIKSLNLKSDQKPIKIIEQPDDIYFSIQFYTDDTFENVNKYIEKLNYDDESIYDLSDFFIMVLNSEIGSDYFLLYKSFQTRELAKNYCVSFLNKLNKCLIVDTTKF